LTGYFDVAAELRLNIVPLLRSVGLTRSMLRSPELPVPAQAVFELLERSAKATSCRTFGLRMVERRRLGDIGLLSVLIAHQPSLREALAVIDEYRDRLNPILRYDQRSDARLTTISVRFLLTAHLGLRQATDIAHAVFHTSLKSVFGDSWRPVSACFSYPAPVPSDLEVYEQLFRCPLEFDAGFDGLIIRSSDLDLTNPNSDPSMAAHVRKFVESVVDPGERSICAEVEAATRTLMPEGRVTIGAVADGLGMNQRTLQRRLDAEGEQFSAILNRLRVEEVRRLATDKTLSLSAVALQLGFSSLAPFSRWYRVQFGESPSAGRKRP
jgi:AraC-like DNA-binding protein